MSFVERVRALLWSRPTPEADQQLLQGVLRELAADQRVQHGEIVDGE